jgi:uncharacterized protein RhaS with RHS repeats
LQVAHLASGCPACGYKTASGRGKWLSRDPIGEAGGLNLYAYVQNNPIDYLDPYGLWSLSFSGYAVFGGGVTISGTGFHLNAITAEAGIGFGGGFSVNPWDKGEPPDPEAPHESNSLGLAASVGAGLGPLGVGISSNAGITEDKCAKITTYNNADLPWPLSPDLSKPKKHDWLKFELEARAAVQLTHNF